VSHYPQLAAELGLPLYGGESYLPAIPILNLIKKPHYIEGAFEGRAIKIHNFSRGSGDSRSSHHAIAMGVTPAPNLTFQLGPETFFSKIGKAVGMQDITTGDPAFDKAFVLKCSDPGFVHGALLPEIRAHFLQIGQLHRFNSLRFKGALLSYEHNNYLGSDSDRQRAAALVPAMSNLAAALEVYGSA